MAITSGSKMTDDDIGELKQTIDVLIKTVAKENGDIDDLKKTITEKNGIIEEIKKDIQGM